MPQPQPFAPPPQGAPYGGPPYGYGPQPAYFTPPPARRGGKTPIIIAGLVILLVLALGITALVVRSGGDSGSTPEQRGRTALATAQVRMLHTAAVHYTGTLTNTPLGRSGLHVDLTVTNVGDATGTVSVRDSARLDYLGVGGKSFLTGDKSAWISLGLDADNAGDYADHPVLIGPDLFGVDLASTLAPARLALALDPNAVRDKPIRVGTPVTIGDHESTPITSGGITTYVRGVRQGGATPTTSADGDRQSDPIVDRVVSDTDPDPMSGDPDLPEFTLDTEPLQSDDAGDIYAQLPGRIDGLDKAVDSRVALDGTLNGRFVQNPCLGTCTVEFTIKNTVKTAPDIVIKTIAYEYTVSVTSSVPIATGPDCAGSGTMAPNSSVTLRCTATYDAYRIRAGTTVPINASAQVIIRALDPEQVRALKDQVQGRGANSGSISPEIPVTIADDWNDYTAAGGKLSKDDWTAARTALGDRSKPSTPPAPNTDWLAPGATQKVPSGWGSPSANSKTGRAGRDAKPGVRWADPNNKGNSIRIDKGDPNNQLPSQQVDHVVVNVNGRIIDRFGNPIIAPKPSKTAEAHIPLSEWLTWKTWDHP
ncbi:hypothetical protein ACFVUS_13640 [Nocardia sp. NPDC058058]|uniref:hypothetical protein n=1 Tax=Nocardia sp. NPDC058058 TaxID=3346317 RepID=UPI0036D940CE